MQTQSQSSDKIVHNLTRNDSKKGKKSNNLIQEFSYSQPNSQKSKETRYNEFMK